METDRHHKEYVSLGKLWIFIDPEGRKFQVHVATGSCCDEADRGINFAKLVSRLPAPAVEVLRQDAEKTLSPMIPEPGTGAAMSSHDILMTLAKVPKALVPDHLMRAFVEHGLRKASVRAREDGWKLIVATDPLCKLAMGLEYDLWRPSPSIVLVKPCGGRVHADCGNGNTKGFTEIAKALRDAPRAFAEKAAVTVTSFWENKNGYWVSAPLVAFIRSLPFLLPQEVWLAVAAMIVKKPRDWHGIEVPKEQVDDRIADMLAKGWSLSALPPEMVTKERVIAFASAHPEIAEEESARNAPHVPFDRDIAMAVASARSGDGLQHVPESFRTREFCLEVLALYPRALRHVPEEYLTIEDCRAVMDACGILLNDVPKRFRDYGTCLRAVAQNGSVLQHVPEELRTEELCRTALDPDQFPHVDFPLRYEDYLRGVSVSGSLLARVPLEFRDAEMCAAAIAKQRDAATHVPPKVLRQLADSAPDLVGSYPSKLSSRYPKSDPIHSFVPSGQRPEALRPLRPEPGPGSNAIVTRPAREPEAPASAM